MSHQISNDSASINPRSKSFFAKLTDIVTIIRAGKNKNIPLSVLLKAIRLVDGYVLITASTTLKKEHLNKILFIMNTGVVLSVPQGVWAQAFQNIVLCPVVGDVDFTFFYKSTYGGPNIKVFTPKNTGPETRLLITAIPDPGTQTTVLSVGNGDLLDADGVRKTLAQYAYDNIGFSGTATLVAGTVTVANTRVKTGNKIFVTVNTPGGSVGQYHSAPGGSIVNATSFVINSSSNTDTSTVNWWVRP